MIPHIKGVYSLHMCCDCIQGVLCCRPLDLIHLLRLPDRLSDQLRIQLPLLGLCKES